MRRLGTQFFALMVGKKEQSDLLALLGPMKKDIVGQ